MKKIILFGLFLLSVFTIFAQARLGLWRDHLQVDVVSFYYRSRWFLEVGSFSGLRGNEYQPAALLFFLLPGLAAKLDYPNYLAIFFGLNMAILASLFLFFNTRARVSLSYLMIVLLTGPILLFRFELLVAGLVLASLVLAKKGRNLLGLAVLGLAVSVKVYPVILLPYFLLSLPDFKKIVNGLAIFALGFFLPLAAVFALGMGFDQILSAFLFHANKPVGLEGIPAGLLTFLIKPTGFISAWGVNGLPPAATLPSLNFYNYLWLPPIIFFYLWLYLKKKLLPFSFNIVFLFITLFLIFSKSLNPQYIFWSLSIFPLLKFKDASWRLLAIFMVAFICFTTQLVYPVLYNQFLEFYKTGLWPEVFWLQTARNIMFIALFLLVYDQT